MKKTTFGRLLCLCEEEEAHGEQDPYIHICCQTVDKGNARRRCGIWQRRRFLYKPVRSIETIDLFSATLLGHGDHCYARSSANPLFRRSRGYLCSLVLLNYHEPLQHEYTHIDLCDFIYVHIYECSSASEPPKLESASRARTLSLFNPSSPQPFSPPSSGL